MAPWLQCPQPDGHNHLLLVHGPSVLKFERHIYTRNMTDLTLIVPDRLQTAAGGFFHLAGSGRHVAAMVLHRNPKVGGRTQLIYRWEDRQLTNTDWKPMGIALRVALN